MSEYMPGPGVQPTVAEWHYIQQQRPWVCGDGNPMPARTAEQEGARLKELAARLREIKEAVDAAQFTRPPDLSISHRETGESMGALLPSTIGVDSECPVHGSACRVVGVERRGLLRKPVMVTAQMPVWILYNDDRVAGHKGINRARQMVSFRSSQVRPGVGVLHERLYIAREVDHWLLHSWGRVFLEPGIDTQVLASLKAL